MATHSSILAWRIPWTEEPGGTYSPWGHKALDTTEREPLSSTKKEDNGHPKVRDMALNKKGV